MKNTLALGLVLVSPLLGGCGGDDRESGVRPPEERIATLADAPTPAEGTFNPSGEYIGSWTGDGITIQDLAAVPADTRDAGEFQLELRNDGTYMIMTPGTGEISGEYRATPGNFLVFSKEPEGCDDNNPGTGVYEWSVEGDELTFTLVRPESGGCAFRTNLLTFPRWNRN